MALRLDGCSRTLTPAAVSSLTCLGASGARLSHGLMSSRRMAMTAPRCWRRRWAVRQLRVAVPWRLRRRNMTSPAAASVGRTSLYILYYAWTVTCCNVDVSLSKALLLHGSPKDPPELREEKDGPPGINNRLLCSSISSLELAAPRMRPARPRASPDPRVGKPNARLPPGGLAHRRIDK
ncbi:hypothetical protein EYF80_048592 [Liparis tanakae]|uniref:Uncharacterized protein n=1 Tax=Liparis tanakae TaxID=230148 RepID=A0A4Z2FJ64_9TELE|nr:hypothetical protein EYF80_048592 [Liparis tanakae]